MTIQKLNKSIKEEITSNEVDETGSAQKRNDELTELSAHLKKSQEEKIELSDKVASLEKAQDIIFEQFKTLELQRKELEDQQKKLEESSEKFRERTIDLFGKMIDLKKAKKTISNQNKKLEIQQKEIEKHQLLVEKSSEKFRDRTIELFGKMIDLKKAKKTISNQREQLKELNASKDKFFSIVAHDLRNPIAGFLNLTDILSANFEVLSEKERKEFIDVMNQASKQLYNLLENLLEWSRAQTGNISYEPQHISLKKMVDNAIDSMMLNIENKRLKINLNVNPETVVYADENMITTVIRNLISNAIKFSNSDSSINLRCVNNDQYIEFSVIDQGVGIPKNVQEKLFKIDQHVTTEGTSEEKGSGLGLILCKEFVEKNGGKIWIESEINKGSSFIFTIPKKSKV